MHISKKPKILLIRTDRIGDVVLTTPIIKILKTHFPNSLISFMTRPETKDIVEGNPYLDEIIIYDQQNQHRGILKTILFSLNLRKKKFDVVIIFNPKKRIHWMSYLATIPMRIGYHKKHGFLLTHRLEDKKGEGKKSEAFYNEDLLSFLEIPSSQCRELYFPLHEKAKKVVDSFLKLHQVTTPFVVINVSSGCSSKSWPIQNFSSLCEKLYERFKIKIIIIGKKEACEKIKLMSQLPLISIAETFGLTELGYLLKRAALHISNDTGPMHIASAVGIPVISIFGRSHPGLGPQRWAPLKGNHNIILQKNIGCNPCLAHLCQLEFDCLKATKVEEVFNAAKKYTTISCR